MKQAKQLIGPKGDWLKWREARDRKLANPRRNVGARLMTERANRERTNQEGSQ